VVLDVERDQGVAGCPDCGVAAIGHGRRVQVLRDAPCFGRPVRVFQADLACPETSCSRRTWTERHEFAGLRAKLTTRAVRWAVDAFRHDDTTVSALARRLGVAWDTCWNAIHAAAKDLLKNPHRLSDQDHRCRRAHLAAVEDLGRGQGRHDLGRPDP
jgi:transposase